MQAVRVLARVPARDSSVPLAGSIRDAADCGRAADLIRQGHPVGVAVGPVCTIWIDAGSEDATEAVYRIKGEKRVGRPNGVVLNSRDFVALLDPDKLPAEMRHLLLDPAALTARFGSLGLLRAPVRRDAIATLPPSILSQTADGTDWLQCYIPAAQDKLSRLIAAIWQQGVRLLAVTSMNISGHPEIVEQAEGAAFCRAHGIPLFLAGPDNRHRVRGSFPIVSLEPTGAKLLREGQYPAYLIEHLLGCVVDTSEARPAKYPVLRTHCGEQAARIPPHRLHDEILAALSGT